ncbi:MAG: helix-turn-helix domain-containing protein [Bdellovibrionota bacterium]
MKYHFKIHKEGKGYWAECLELQGCQTQGESMEELERNMSEALNLYLDEPAESDLVFPLPRRSVKGRGTRAVSVDPQTAFAFLLRRARLRANLTQRQAAERIGITGSLYGYQRLERGATAKPGFEILAHVKRAFPEICIDDLFDAA